MLLCSDCVRREAGYIAGMAAIASAANRTEKYARRRAEILDVASGQINVNGARGMTLTAVAKALGLDTSSVNYYFKRKDALAAACLERTLEWHREVALAAAAEPDPRARVRAYLRGHFALHRRQRDPTVARLAVLSDMRAIDRENRTPLDDLYAEMFRVVRGYFNFGDGPGAKSRSLISAIVLVGIMHWVPAWIDRYLVRDFDRLEARLFDILDHGLAPDADWPVDHQALESDDATDAQSRFLHAATNLINRDGYIGASVEKIAAELGLSTGSFYHHLDNKDDLVVACFQRSFALVEAAQARADERGADSGDRLAIMASALVALQFTGRSPLLRMSAYQALPVDLRARMFDHTSQVTRHVAGTISDGGADHSLRAIDATIASETVMATIDSAADLRQWAARRPLDVAVRSLLSTLRCGLF